MINYYLCLLYTSKVVPIKYGDMDQWIIRKVHESGVIGGNTKLLYEIGPTDVYKRQR